MATYLNPSDRLKNRTVEQSADAYVIDDKSPVSEKYTVKQLKAMCKREGLTGYSKLKENELIKLLGL